MPTPEQIASGMQDDDKFGSEERYMITLYLDPDLGDVNAAMEHINQTILDLRQKNQQGFLTASEWETIDSREMVDEYYRGDI